MIYINARFLTQKITGVQRFAVELSRKIKANNKDVLFLTPKGIVNEAIAKELGAVQLGMNVGVVWEQYDLPKFLKKQGNPLLLNLCNTAPLFYKNKIVTIHDIAFKINSAWFSKSFVLYYSFIIPFILKNSKGIITVSQFSKSELIKHYKVKEGKIFVVYNGVNEFFCAHDKRINTQYKIVLAVGSIDPRKNLTMLIHAFVDAGLKNVKLIIVGEHNKIFATGAQMETPDSVIFTGRVDDTELKKLYSTAAVFVYPSLYEGFGLPPIEAMNCGCPVITSNVASLPEICGDAALYIQPDNKIEISAAIINMLNDDVLSAGFIERGYLCASKYSWNNSYNQLKNALNDINSFSK